MRDFQASVLRWHIHGGRELLDGDILCLKHTVIDFEDLAAFGGCPSSTRSKAQMPKFARTSLGKPYPLCTVCKGLNEEDEAQPRNATSEGNS